jgi:hypothetical protein
MIGSVERPRRTALRSESMLIGGIPARVASFTVPRPYTGSVVFSWWA